MPDQQATEVPAVQETFIQSRDLSGQKVYAEFCASCHDSGLQGAPVVGKAADWEDRSQLWQALLMEHAKAGYLDMPAKGGSEELSDLSVSYAVEYMMLETFPDQLPD